MGKWYAVYNVTDGGCKQLAICQIDYATDEIASSCRVEILSARTATGRITVESENVPVNINHKMTWPNLNIFELSDDEIIKYRILEEI